MAIESAGVSARSDDGRSFVVSNAAGSAFIAGSLVVLVDEGWRQLALIEERSETPPVRLRGRLIGELTEDGIDTRRSHAFERATLEPADAKTVASLHETTGAMLEVWA
ncbi:hypothetical protein [Nocardia crassostreae]|uniref:hypothetical protein n=1 Tax=Nocardia crassostreae TaxID=53428 RepID=UPI000835624C|nr:hypothetical protein [Nocardia crassostreae]